MISLRMREADAAPSELAAEPWVAPLFHRPLTPGEGACCCPARAVFAVVLAPSGELPQPPDVLLCAHHARAAHGRLAGADIALYDAAGVIVTEHLAGLLAEPDPVPSVPAAEPALG